MLILVTLITKLYCDQPHHQVHLTFSMKSVFSVANSWKSARSPAGDLPRKSGSPDQMLLALIDKE